MTARRTSKQIYVYDEDARFIKEHLRDELNLPTYADVVHELIESYKKEKVRSKFKMSCKKNLPKAWKSKRNCRRR